MGFYSDLLANGGPWVTFERCVERAFAAVAAAFEAESGGVLSGAAIYEGHRGLPRVFGGWKTTEVAESFADVLEAADHVLLLASGREDAEGEESCELAVVVATMASGGDPEGQLTKHEQRVAGMRGILSDGACEETGTDSVRDRLNTAETQTTILGWAAKEGPGEMEYTGGRWVTIDRYQVRGKRNAS